MGSRQNTSFNLGSEADGRLQREFDNTYRTKQDIAHVLLKRVPGLSEVPERGFILALVSGTLSMYTKVEGKLHKLDFTVV